MSLTSTPPTKQFSYAIFASKNFDDSSFLAEAVGGNLAHIGHVYTNGANRLVEDFARENGIACTIFPLTHSNLYTSTNLILERAEAAYIVADDSSKSAAQIREMCEKKGVGHKWLAFEPITHWKLKVCRAQEILAALPKGDLGDLDESWKSVIEALRKAL